MPAALAGLRVLEFTHALAGPYCTLLLASYGADVYKLESPGGGDMGRDWGPPFSGGQSHFFLGLNHGKRGLSIDLKHPEGLALCLRLTDRMDVLIENFRPGAMDRLGLGYTALSARNPRLVYCSISGYGQYGPSREEAAMDLIVEASSGFMSITGTEQGEVVRSGYAVADINAGMSAAIGILVALRAREATGRGQYVDISMFDSMVSAMTSNYMYHLGSGVVPGPLGSGFPTVVPYRVFAASDRPFALAVGSARLWAAFCAAIGRPDLEQHPRFATNSLRVVHRQELEGILAEVFVQSPVSAWLERLQAAGIPCSAVRDFAEVVQSPQAAARNLFPSIDCPTAGAHRVTAPPVQLSGTPGHPGAPAPLLGEHNRQTLADLLELDSEAIDGLLARGVLGAPD